MVRRGRIIQSTSKRFQQSEQLNMNDLLKYDSTILKALGCMGVSPVNTILGIALSLN